MKKLSISLFAVLAIVFAVSSAFTTKSVKTGSSTTKLYEFPSNTIDPSDLANEDSQAILDAEGLSLTDVDNDASVSDWNTTDNITQYLAKNTNIECDGLENVCMAILTRNDAGDIVDVVEVKAGNFVE